MYSRPQKLAAELFGTFAVVLVSAGAICADQFLKTTQSAAALARSASPWPMDCFRRFGAVALRLRRPTSRRPSQPRRDHRLLGHAQIGHCSTC